MKLPDCYGSETVKTARSLLRKRVSLHDVRSRLIAKRDAYAAALQKKSPPPANAMLLPFRKNAATTIPSQHLLSLLRESETHLHFVDTLSQEYPRPLTLKALNIPEWKHRYRILLKLDAPENDDQLESHKMMLVHAAVVEPHMRSLPIPPLLTIAIHAAEQQHMDLLGAMERHIASAILDILDPDDAEQHIHGAKH